jgi:hypothetical protein
MIRSCMLCDVRMRPWTAESGVVAAMHSGIMTTLEGVTADDRAHVLCLGHRAGCLVPLAECIPAFIREED